MTNLGRVAVTGASGFIGGAVFRRLLRDGHDVVGCGWRSDRAELKQLDMRDPASAAILLDGVDTVIHCAALVGTLVFKMNQPATVMGDNLRMTIAVLDAAAAAGVRRVTYVSSAEVYNGMAESFKEEDAHNDEPSPTNAGYVWAKRASEIYAALAEREYGFRLSIVRPNNVYGPGDDFSPDTGRAIPSMISRGLRGDDIVLWGDGTQSRAFLYIDDLVDGILCAATEGAGTGPINLGATEEIALKDLAEHIAAATGGKSRVVLDTSKPSGPRRRLLNVEKAETLLNFQPQVPLFEGIERTIHSTQHEFSY